MESFGELFRISTIDEIRTRLRKRLSKARKRKENGEEAIKIDWDLSLVFTSLCEIKFDGKVRALDMFMDTELTCKIVALTLSNKLDLHLLNIQDKTVEQLPSIEKSAHRTEVRCLAFSSDDMLIASGSGESLKIWNRFVCVFERFSLLFDFLGIVVNRSERFLVLMHFAVCFYRVII